MLQLIIRLCIIIFLFAPLHAMDNRQWPDCHNLSCPEPNKESDKQAWLDANPSWKRLTTATQKEKNKFLRNVFTYFKISADSWNEYRKALACTLAIGASPNIAYSFDSNINLLSEVLNHDDYYLVELALKCGANVNKTRVWANQAFGGEFVAPLLCVQSKKMLTLLIEYKADVTAKNRFGETILHIVNKTSFSADAIPFLVQHGCNVDAQDDERDTPIMSTIYSNHFKQAQINIRLLLKAGADLTIKNNDDQTLWDIAKDMGRLEKVQRVYNQFQQERTAYGLLINNIRLFSN